MQPISENTTRVIIEDFAKAILQRARPTAKPADDVINFRNELSANITRPIVEVPIELLRYRKDNGRIASDVMNYVKENGPLDEKDEDAQEELRKFLEHKDPQQTTVLMKSIEHSGQHEPAIITCDGFLINGNRRKMVLKKLSELHHGNEKYLYMKVVILPGPDDVGGPPTLLEIERIENRYQLQREGKSEYSGFDRALSMKRKIDLGFSLKEQLRDDPQYIRSSDKELARAVRKSENDYLEPLECAERYLRHFGREGMYASISEGPFDKEGRWQAFVDYNKAYKSLTDKNWQGDADGFDEDDIGEIEDAAFKIIRLRVLPNLPKVHEMMRRFPRFCAHRDIRKEILKISRDSDASLPPDEAFDGEGNPLSPGDVDRKWAKRYQQTFVYHAKKANEYLENLREKETPITLLEAAYKKLTHENLNISSVAYSDFIRVHELAANIQVRAHEIEQELYKHKKSLKALERKK